MLKLLNGGGWLITSRSTNKGTLKAPNTTVSTPIVSCMLLMLIMIASRDNRLFRIVRHVNNNAPLPHAGLSQ